MSILRYTILPILIATIWISLSEFIRNEFILKTHWVEHYNNMGLTFPSEPVNGMVWGIWSLSFALGIYFLSRKFNLLQTTGIAWLFGFLLMWEVTGNMDVLPFSILPIAIPLSLLEAFLAAFIIHRLGNRSKH